MVRIGLISDTHGYIDDRILEHFSDCNEIWHAGDIGDQEVIDKLSQKIIFRAVHGNIDDLSIRNQYPENLIFELENLKVWITHIGALPPSYNKKIRRDLMSIHPDLFVCGHSHIVRIIPDRQNNLLYINPGAAGQQGFHKIRTLVRFAIDGGQVKNLQVVELGRRGVLSRDDL